MLNIIWALFVAWFLNIWGFSNVWITGFNELFGITISVTTYYFIFGAVGLLKNIIEKIHYNENLKVTLNKIDDILK